jgi:predicted transcriptional regulator
LVSAARVKKIRLAQDVINSAEESVYDTLWNAKLVAAEESCRLVQAGYDYLVKRTRLSRKTIQRIVAKLLEKDFIEVDTRADIYQRVATVYRVFSYKAVLERNIRKGRLHVAKMGPGFSYARPLQATQESTQRTTDQTTIDMSDVSSVVSDDMATVVKPSTVTMVKTDQPTVVKMSPYLLDTKSLDITSSASPAVASALASFGTVDDDVITQLVAACRSYAADCTEEEIVHFIREKGKVVQRRDNRIQNPVGFLLTAVPKCFSAHALAELRGKQSRERAEVRIGTRREIGGEPEDPALVRWRKDQEAALLDPSVSEQEKHLIRLCLGLNTPPH